ncbi:MAG: hypothetical protein ACYC26_02455 [Phycisphaerales bacterium]
MMKRWRRAARAGVWMVVVALCCATGGESWGQESGEIRGSATGGGLGVVTPGRWGMVQTSVANETGSDAGYRVVWWFASQPGRQFVRKVWVPAGCVRRVVWPVLYEGRVGPNRRTIQSHGVEGSVRLLAEGQDRELGSSPSLMMVSEEQWMTAAITGESDAAIDGIVALRGRMGLGKRLAYPGDPSHQLPRTAMGWSSADMAVFARKDLRLDPAQRRALRQWIHNGGAAWVMLDQVEEGSLSEWLGDDAPLTEVDRVGLTRVQLRSVAAVSPNRVATRQLRDEAVVSETPMTLVRVLADGKDGWERVLTAGDWPGVIERRVGAGRLIVSTVDARAWTDARSEEAATAMARAVYPDRSGADQPMVDAKTADHFVNSRIGYEVAGRSAIAAVLGLYLALFAAVGWMQWRKGRAEAAVGFGLAMAVIAGGALVVIGYTQRGKVKATDASLQLVSVEPGAIPGAEALVRGRMVLFAPFARTASLGSDRGGWAWPAGRGDGGIRRLVWTDMDTWAWRELKIDGGSSQPMDFQMRVVLDRPVSLQWRVDERGLAATLPADESQRWQDMVLVTDRAVCAVTAAAAPGSDGASELRIVPDSVLPRGNYVGSGVMTQTQRERNSVLTAITSGSHRPRGSGPMVLGWGELIDDGLRDDAAVLRRGSSLWLMPMRLTPAAAGQRVTLPWPVVGMRSVRNAGGMMSGMVYNERDGEFLKISLPGSFVGRFTPPAEVGPLRLDGATLVLSITAIGRPVRILNVTGGGNEELAKLDSPDGTYRIALPAGRLTMRDGAVTLAVDVGNLADMSRAIENQSSMWQIQQLGLELRGVRE